MIHIRSSAFCDTGEGYLKTYTIILSLIFMLKFCFYDWGGIFMSKYPFFYDRIFKHETLGRIQFQDLNSEYIHSLCIFHLAKDMGKLGDAIAFRNHWGAISVAKRATSQFHFQLWIPATWGASQLTFLNLILPICKKGTFPRCRDTIYRVSDRSRRRGVYKWYISGSLALCCFVI